MGTCGDPNLSNFRVHQSEVLFRVHRINHDNHNASVRPQESSHLQSSFLFYARTASDSNGPRGEKFAEMSHRVELDVLVKLSCLWVNNDGGRVIVPNPVWTSVLVQNKVPISPSCHLIIQWKKILSNMIFVKKVKQITICNRSNKIS